MTNPRNNKMSYSLKKGFLFSSLLGTVLPFLAFAQDPAQVESIFIALQGSFTILIAVLFLIMTVIFLWGVVKYVLASQDEKAREQAKAIMTLGIIGLFVAAAAWGIVNLLINYFGTDPGTIPSFPGDNP